MLEAMAGGLVGWLVGGAAGGVLGNVADRTVASVWEEVRSRVAGHGALPENHDLERAIRLAQLSASLFVIREWQREFSHTWANRDDATEPRFAAAAELHLHAQLGLCWQLAVERDDDLARELARAMDAGLADPTGPAEGYLRLRVNAEQAAYADLTAGLNGMAVPDAFHDRFMGRRKDATGWHAAFITFVREIFANNPRAKTGLVVRDLSTILLGVNGLTRLVEALSADIAVVKNDTGVIRVEQTRQTASLADIKQLLQSDILHLPRIRAALPASFAGVADEGLPEAVRTFVARAEAIEQELSRRTNFPAEVEAARQRASALVEQLRIEEAEHEIASARALLREARQQTSREEAGLLSDEADLATLRLAYREAAALLDQAAELVRFDPSESWTYSIRAAHALDAQGSDLGDNEALREVVRRCEHLLATVSKAVAPAAWANTQNTLANALTVLGQRGDDDALNRAIPAFKAAIDVDLDFGARREAAQKLSNLANALWAIGERGNEGSLREADEACTLATEWLDLITHPEDWAMAHNNLGGILTSLAERYDPNVLPRARAAHLSALKVHRRRTKPLLWALSMNNLGHTLAVARKRGNRTAGKRAICAFRAALTERRRDRVPLMWAMTMYNLGLELTALADAGDREAAIQATDALQLALQERTFRRSPLEWGLTQSALGMVLLIRVEQGESPLASDALAALRAAQFFYTQERYALKWAQLEMNCGVCLQHRSAGRNVPDLTASIGAYRAAIEVFDAIGATDDARAAKSNLLEAEGWLGRRGMPAAPTPLPRSS